MAFRLVSSGGDVSDPAAVNLYASGTINVNNPVDFSRTSGQVVAPTTSSSTTTMVFGVARSYAQGASDTQVKVIPFVTEQLWEADCANAASTAQIGIRHALSASDRSCIHNTSTSPTNNTGFFLALNLSSSTSGSGKLIGRIISDFSLVGQNATTFN